MDISLLEGAFVSLNLAKEMGKAALGLRDFNEMAPALGRLNDQLLKAQDALFAHNAQLLALQNEKFETAKQLAELKEALAQKGRYSLVELSLGIFVYRANFTPVDGHVSDPVSAQPIHYLCCACFDKGVKVVLRRVEYAHAVTHCCSGCKEYFLETRKPRLEAPQRQGPGSDEWKTRW